MSTADTQLQWSREPGIGPTRERVTVGPYELTAYDDSWYVAVATIDRRHEDVAHGDATSMDDAKAKCIAAALADAERIAEIFRKAKAPANPATFDWDVSFVGSI